MKSNVCKVDNGTADLAAILAECERVAAYNGLTHKQALHLRLLCEEMDGMLPRLVENFEGELYIDCQDGVCKINISLTIPEISSVKKEELIGIAKNRRNACAVGIVGKIRDALETVFLVGSEMGALDASPITFAPATGYSEGVDYAYLWSLDRYRSSVKENDESERWDELEKSVIASVADDVIVGVRGKKAEIVIVKRFQ